ncbi:type II toxin-antitoxin system PemK/MazF family toxin [uncultured Sphingomonas sp.]|uniref:type II toxin-antitoxin system PemK/MazF family toxin n=1 Tax=uncultured Sphingomonas sp. TaxID=158754 RepID=UPI0035C996A0
MKRGDLVTAALAGNYGKPRPCLIVQSDRLAKLGSVLLCPLTSDLSTAGPTRVKIIADVANGLAADSLVMIDKVTAIPRARCRDRIGAADTTVLKQVNGLLLLALGLLD